MNSERVKEIKKALKYCSEGKCEKCLIGKKDIRKCVDILLKDTLTLINELESENKELKRYKLDWINSEKMHLQADMEDTEFELFCANNSLDEVRAENKELKDRIVELEKEKESLKKQLIAIDTLDETNFEKRHNAIVFITEKQLKQFAERLKEKKTKRLIPVGLDQPAKEVWFIELTEEEIDETLKEFINE